MFALLFVVWFGLYMWWFSEPMLMWFYLLCGGFIFLYVIQLILCLLVKERFIKFIPSIIESVDFISCIILFYPDISEYDVFSIWARIFVISVIFTYVISMGLAFMTFSIVKKHRARKLAANGNIIQTM